MATKKHTVTRVKFWSAWGCKQRYWMTNGELGYLLVRHPDHWVFWRKSTYPFDQSQYEHIFKWTNHIPKQMHEPGAKRGEIDWTSRSWFWFNLWLVEKVAPDFLANHSTFHKCFDKWLYLHPLEWVLQPWPLLFVEDEDSFHRHQSLHCKEYRRTRWNGRSDEVEQQPRIPKTA